MKHVELWCKVKRSSFLLLLFQVGFSSLVLQVSDVTHGRCDASLSRTGLYGDVNLHWKAGFPLSQTPSGYQPGIIIPSSGWHHTFILFS